jgi:hypothetical protein
MNHSFVKPFDSSDKCGKCKFPEIAHSDKATCEACPNIGPVDIRYGNILMCDSCWTKEQNLKAESMRPENVQNRVNAMNAAMDVSRKIDAAVSVRPDLFNAATTAIVDMKKLIDENPEITNKPFTLATELKNRFEHFQKVVFEANEQIIAATNNQKAIQVYLNNLANSLRAEEREKLKIQDISYKPIAPKTPTVKTVTTKTSKKIDKALLRKYAIELGVSDFTLQSFVVSSGCTVEEAADKIRKSIAAAKAQS